MSREVDYYAVLQVRQGADEANIRAAYRTLAKHYHPDVTRLGTAQALETFHLITQAYETLGDPRRRAQYDARRLVPKPPGLRAARAANHQTRQPLRVGNLLARTCRIAVWSVVLAAIVMVLLILAELLRGVAVPRHGTAGSEADRPAGNMIAAPPILPQLPHGDVSVGASQLSEPVPLGLGRVVENHTGTVPLSPRMEMNIRQSDCVSEDGRGFTIVNQAGQPKIAYDGGPIAPASIEYEGRRLLILSRIVPDNSISIVIVRGEQATTTLVLTDRQGRILHTKEAVCRGTAF